MALNEETRKTLRLLMEHELALKELYQAYAALFPSRADLWLRLAGDEQHHGDWLHTLLTAAEAAQDQRPCLWPRTAAVEASLRYVRTQIVRAGGAEIPLLTALAVAQDLENALLEKEFFKAAEGVCPEVHKVLDRLVVGTERHWRLVTEALDHARHAQADAARK
jgi:hypothetical protein